MTGVVCDRYNRTWAQDLTGAAGVLRELLGGLGEDTEIRAPLYVDYGKYLAVGARTFISYNLTPAHPVEAGPRRDKLEAAKPIAIGNNVWIGGGAVVLPGVTVGENSVIGAGAVVTRDVPANVVVVGNPAHVVRDL